MTMNYYSDITIKPDAEMRENVLLNKVYTKLHKALHDLNSKKIGVSFPRYNLKLGTVIRLHGNRADLNALHSVEWLGGLIGYSNVSEISEVPNDVLYRTVSRTQCNMSSSKLRRLIKRGSIPETDVKAYKAKVFTQSLTNPYLEVVSTTNGKLYRRFISFSDLTQNPSEGEFDSFGLSKTATIPWF